MAWHGGPGPGMAWRGLAGRGRERFTTCRRQPSAVPAHRTTGPTRLKTTSANHLTAYGECCHGLFTEHIWFISFVSSGRSTGTSIGRGRGAVISGMSRPRVGEVIAILLRCSREWRGYVVTVVIDRRPDS